MWNNSGTGWRLSTRAVTSGLPLFATPTMINQPPLEALGLTLLSEKHITVVIISCKLHSMKIDKQRTSSTNQWKANTVYNMVMQIHPIPSYKSFLSVPRSQSAFHGFVSKITTEAGCGGDTPEDIMGALKVAFTSLSWRSEGSKVYHV